MAAILTSVASSAIIALCSWGGGQMLAWYKKTNTRGKIASTQVASGQVATNQVATAMPEDGATRPMYMAGGAYPAYPAYPTYPAYPQYPQYPVQSQPPSVNASKVLVHIGILQLVVNIVGLVIGIFLGAVGASEGVSVLFLFLFGTLAAAIVFFIFGLRVERAVRWRHLTYVVLGTVPLTLLVNALFYAAANKPLYTTVGQFIFAVIVAFFQTFLAMGIGGGLAALISPKRGLQAPGALPAPQQYMPGMPPYGAPYGYGQPGAASTPMAYPSGAYSANPAYPPNPPYAAYPPNPAYPPNLPYPPPAAYPSAPSYPLPAGAYPSYPPGTAYPPAAAYPPASSYPPPPGPGNPGSPVADAGNPSTTPAPYGRAIPSGGSSDEPTAPGTFEGAQPSQPPGGSGE
ncbi:MAG: hypothetical protein ACLQUY_02250 [Ktedonobacterales bacterium]